MLALVCTLAWGSSAWALDKKDGAYQIGTADDLTAFAAIVNGGENNANAVLTADIDMTGKTWTPIGNNDNRYVGTFDGQYHVIDNLVCTGTDKIGIFGVVNGGCVVKNLVAGAGNKITGTAMVGGIIGCSDGSGWVTLENVGHEGYVEGSGNNCCAIFGVVMNGGPATRITNCYNTGDIKAGGESAIITGWFGGHGSVEVKGFWNTGKILSGGDGDNSLWRNSTGITIERLFHTAAHQGATVIGDGDVASGRLAFQLNGNADAGTWRQNLSDPKDAHPTCDPSHAKVYANGTLDCAGNAKEGSAMTYSNTEGSVRDEHDFVGGFCSVCGIVQDDFVPQDAQGYYLISDGDQLNWFAYQVNAGKGDLNALLTADIDMQDKAWTPIGQDGKDYRGNFNGQGHRILRLTTNANRDNQALFGQAVGGAVIENVIIDASCNIVGKAFTAGILGHVWADGVIVRNCGNEADISGSAQNAAGIVGCSEKIVHISNCYNLGQIEGSHENAGICAWMGSGSSTIKNCYSTAEDVDGEALWRNGSVQGENMYQIEGKQGAAFTSEQMESGELAYLLNGKQSTDVQWYQAIGTDTHPLPFGTSVVYANGTLDCAGNAKEGSALVYSNTEGATRDDHHFDDGFCTVCATPDPDYLEAEDGAYTLATPHQLAWFAAIVNSGNTTASARLYGDIDFSDAAGFQGIGTFSNPFCGNFDGQGAIVSNLTIIMPGEENVGFFRVIGAGANISNFTIDESCTFSGKAFTGAFAGRGVGNGEATLQRLGNEGSVNTTDQNAGAIVGCNTSSELHLSLTNCYNAGSISSGWEAGGLSGWLGNDANTTNCYNMGTVTNGESFARGNNIQVVNCFDPVTDWPALPKSPIEDFTNGVIYDKLAAAAGDGIWFLSAKENGHPVLYDSGITTGIDDLQIFDLRFDGAVYDLSGRKMVNGKLPKGIYVKDGRKVILR